jgi:hypothetical protein
MFRFIQGAPCRPHKAPIVQVAAPTNAFGDIRPDAVGRPDNLPSDGILGEVVPPSNHGPDFVSQSFGKLVHLQVFEIRP